MKLTAANVNVTNTLSTASLTIGNNAVVDSLTLGNVSINSTMIAVGANVKITPVAITTPTLTVGGFPFSGGLVGGIIDYQEFAANGTWYNPYANSSVNSTMSGSETVFMMMWGGGGGAAANGISGKMAGGGGGACVIGQLQLTSFTNSCAVTVGPGGASISQVSTGNGTNGGNTVFVVNATSTITAYGGAGALGNTTALTGGAGAGIFGNGNNGAAAVGGGPLGGNTSVKTSTFGGAGPANTTLTDTGGFAVFGGGGGGNDGGVGGDSIYGGGGGVGGSANSGNSVFGGKGLSASITNGIPGGGGGSGRTGARGEVRVWVFGPAGTTAGAPTYTLTANTTSLVESESALYTVSTTNVANNTTLYYTLNNSSTAASKDFTTAVNGSIVISGGTGTFTLTANNDADAANQAFQIDIRQTSTTGTIVASNSSFNILPAATAVYTDSVVSETSATTYTFTNRSFGTASSDRYIIVMIGATNNNRTISSVTIGGVTATQIGQVTYTDATSYSTSGMYIAAVPTGTTGTVVVTFSGGETMCGIGIYAAYNLKSATPVDMKTVGASGSSNTITLNTGGGFYLATAATKDNGIVSWSWTGATENFDTPLRISSADRAFSGASGVSAPGTATVTLSPSQSGTITAVAASFR